MNRFARMLPGSVGVLTGVTGGAACASVRAACGVHAQAVSNHIGQLLQILSSIEQHPDPASYLLAEAFVLHIAQGSLVALPRKCCDSPYQIH